ncbi:MAG TPA: FeoA family protein [Bacteriovoracaceae bacterium]|nr:FeoA family protein [Bacteriovoracaceae bacterium]
MMTINQAPLNKKLIVRSFHDSHERDFNEIESRLMLLGFLDGQIIKVTKKAPLFKEPFLVEVRGRMIALSKDEAMLVEVEVVE